VEGVWGIIVFENCLKKVLDGWSGMMTCQKGEQGEMRQGEMGWEVSKQLKSGLR
jgi:hypothetical protein